MEETESLNNDALPNNVASMFQPNPAKNELELKQTVSQETRENDFLSNSDDEELGALIYKSSHIT